MDVTRKCEFNFSTALTIALGTELMCMIACLRPFLYTQGKKGVWIKLPRQLIGLAEAAVKVMFTLQIRPPCVLYNKTGCVF